MHPHRPPGSFRLRTIACLTKQITRISSPLRTWLLQRWPSQHLSVPPVTDLGSVHLLWSCLTGPRSRSRGATFTRDSLVSFNHHLLPTRAFPSRRLAHSRECYTQAASRFSFSLHYLGRGATQRARQPGSPRTYGRPDAQILTESCKVHYSQHTKEQHLVIRPQAAMLPSGPPSLQTCRGNDAASPTKTSLAPCQLRA